LPAVAGVGCFHGRCCWARPSNSNSSSRDCISTLARLTTRALETEPFYAVAIYGEAVEMMRAGRDVRLMCVGEPDFPTPERVVNAAVDALRRGETHYTVPAGIPELRSAISRHYTTRYGVTVPAERILVTAGGSAALTLAFGVLANPGDEFLMADPGYPSNRALLTFCGAKARHIPVGAGRSALDPQYAGRDGGVAGQSHGDDDS
jgi:aspartate/methionine/tyrosine aminotransferase